MKMLKITVMLVMIVLLEILVAECVTYQFKRYTFKKKRDDKKYKNSKQRCELSGECTGILGLEHTKCIRKCVSEFCYDELYGGDELEDGEIDVRLNSFKGCLAQQPGQY